MRYFDSGLLLKLYLSEPREKEAEQWFYSSPPPPFTHLHALEMRSAVRQKLGRGEIDLAESERVLQLPDLLRHRLSRRRRRAHPAQKPAHRPLLRILFQQAARTRRQVGPATPGTARAP